MAGKVSKRKGRNNYHVSWYDKNTKKTTKIYQYKGERMYHSSIAERLLISMQTSVENGTFVLERFTKPGFTDVVPFIEHWLEIVRDDLQPATYKGYKSYVKNHIKPYFQENNHISLHDIQLDVLKDFKQKLPLSPKTKINVMYCLHAILDYAKRSRRIVEMPSFPRKKEYQLIKKPIKWLSEERQLHILEQIPKEHQPVFYFLKYHVRRPAEACAMLREDYENGVFTICRSISARKHVNKTKTGEIHTIPCVSAFKPFLEYELKKPIASQFFFKNPRARKAGQRYTNESLNTLWKEACKKAGEHIDLYSGLKHSSCSQFINEKGLSESDVQIITDHARIDSVRNYAKTEVKRKRELMESKIIDLVRHNGQHRKAGG
ncbi:MAG: tyrosine-type recombinase/integrase family protein [Desulfobacteraceae bacterium]|nr:tyrosine-type recombinase/integrase family protein [Desulfobacteraceae bacterium]